MSARPVIVSPVMRVIGVADAAQSAKFYTGILGFETREGLAEVVSGPARIQFAAHDYAPNDWEHPCAPGSAMLFFETGDIASAGVARFSSARSGSQ
jgi:catechol 2,3-dioxygenase-like lactoylglutathione lyase family enzyme